MKQFILLMAVLGFAAKTHAQTNTFPTTGNVGIGTTTPQAKLQVTGGGLSVTGANTQTGINGFKNFVQLVDPAHAAILYNPGESTQLMMGFHSNGGIYWGTTTYSMILSKAGHLKIHNTLSVGGDLKSGSKLSVDGKIAAKEVEVTTSNWPDYVFQKDYKLLSLDSVASFINENGHLPEMPKAADVEANGVQLGEMNKLLLKKVEELTLHLIEIARVNETLSAKVEEMQIQQQRKL